MKDPHFSEKEAKKHDSILINFIANLFHDKISRDHRAATVKVGVMNVDNVVNSEVSGVGGSSIGDNSARAAYQDDYLHHFLTQFHGNNTAKQPVSNERSLEEPWKSLR